MLLKLKFFQVHDKNFMIPIYTNTFCSQLSTSYQVDIAFDEIEYFLKHRNFDNNENLLYPIALLMQITEEI